MVVEKSEAGVPRRAAEALADPIVQALMAADGVDRNRLEELLRRVAARLARQDPGRGEAHRGGALARLARSFALVVAVMAGVVATQAAAAETVPVAFIRNLGGQALTVIHSDMPLSAKATYFGQMLRQDFDLPGLCRFVLGPYRRRALPVQRVEFCNLFAENLVRYYGHELAQAGDGSFTVTGSRPDANEVIVTSRIERPQGAPITVDWRLGVSDGHYRIEDVAIDGVSMALAQRAEITAIIGRGGGQFGILLATMREEG